MIKSIKKAFEKKETTTDAVSAKPAQAAQKPNTEATDYKHKPLHNTPTGCCGSCS